MASLRPLVALGNYRAAPLTVGIRTLPRGCVSTRVGIVGASGTGAAVHATATNGAPASSSGRVIPGSPGDASVWSIRSAGYTVRSGVRIVVSPNPVGDRIGSIDRIRIRPVIIVGRVIVSAPVNNGGSHRRSDDEHPEITCRATRFNLSAGRGGLRHIGDVVDRRA